jgi:hemerythrin superfamily protein
MENSSTQAEHSQQHERPGRVREMTLRATDLLKADHENVEGLFAQYELAEDQAAQEKKAFVEQICRELQVHAQLEEEIFYPALRAKVYEDGRDLVAQSLEEHQTIKGLIKNVQALSPEDPGYDSLFHELMDEVHNHIEREEDELFFDMEQQLSDELARLGRELQHRKQQLLTSAH